MQPFQNHIHHASLQQKLERALLASMVSRELQTIQGTTFIDTLNKRRRKTFGNVRWRLSGQFRFTQLLDDWSPRIACQSPPVCTICCTSVLAYLSMLNGAIPVLENPIGIAIYNTHTHSLVGARTGAHLHVHVCSSHRQHRNSI